jgi:hypothetical protein
MDCGSVHVRLGIPEFSFGRRERCTALHCARMRIRLAGLSAQPGDG